MGMDTITMAVNGFVLRCIHKSWLAIYRREKRLQNMLANDNTGWLVFPWACGNGIMVRGEHNNSAMVQLDYHVKCACTMWSVHMKKWLCIVEATFANMTRRKRKDPGCLSFICCCLVNWSVYQLPVRGQRSPVCLSLWFKYQHFQEQSRLPLAKGKEFVDMAYLTKDVWTQQYMHVRILEKPGCRIPETWGQLSHTI